MARALQSMGKQTSVAFSWKLTLRSSIDSCDQHTTWLPEYQSTNWPLEEQATLPRRCTHHSQTGEACRLWSFPTERTCRVCSLSCCYLCYRIRWLPQFQGYTGCQPRKRDLCTGCNDGCRHALRRTLGRTSGRFVFRGLSALCVDRPLHRSIQLQDGRHTLSSRSA